MKLTFRPFKECDAAAVASWITDEPAMRLWSADRYERFPLAAADICRSYAAEAMNDCFIAFTLLCDDTVAGHVVMVHPGGRRDAIRLVYTIVDPRRRRSKIAADGNGLCLQIHGSFGSNDRCV